MGKHGVTVKDIAKACGFSVSTVNYILNGNTKYKYREATKTKVLNTANKLGYKKNVIASGFRLNNNRIIFGIVSRFCRQADLKLLIAMKQALYKRGYKFAVQFLIDMTDEDRLDFFSRIQGWGAGLVVLTLEVDDKEKYGLQLEKLLKLSPPSISLMGKIPGSSMNYTQVGWEERKELIAKYFQEKGCSNIAVCLPPYQLDIGTKWVKQIRETGLKVTLLSSEKLKLFDYQAFGQAIALDIIESGSQYDGIYSIYDEITFGIYEVFRKFKIKVPEDVVIMSGGDCDFCHMFSPPIPVFIHDCDELAELAAKDLVKRIEAGDKKTGNEKCVGKVYQKIIETNDTFSNRTIKHEISIIKKEC